MFGEKEYCLKYKNETVFIFNIESQTIEITDEALLPIGLQNKPFTYDLVKRFCADRILMRNRKYTILLNIIHRRLNEE